MSDDNTRNLPTESIDEIELRPNKDVLPIDTTEKVANSNESVKQMTTSNVNSNFNPRNLIIPVLILSFLLILVIITVYLRKRRVEKELREAQNRRMSTISAGTSLPHVSYDRINDLEK